MPRALTVDEIEDFRHELCEVAADLFAREGYDAVTMRSIARELGVSAMTPYRYFDSKGAIYKAVRAQAFARFGARVSAAAATETDLLKRLRALFRAYLTFALEESGSYRIMFELDPPPDATPDAADHALAGETWQPLLRTIDEAVASGVLEGDPLTLANLCWVHVHGLASLHIAGRLRFGRSFDDLVDPLFETLLYGIRSRPKGALS